MDEKEKLIRYIEQVISQDKQPHLPETILPEDRMLWNALHQLAERYHSLTEQTKQQAKQYENLMRLYKRMHSFRHDFKNHCFSVNKLLERGNYKAAEEYIKTSEQVMGYGQEQVISTGNLLFDAIVQDKIDGAREKGIQIKTFIKIGESLQVSDFDWCVILGNIFDNAIEACECLESGEEKKIRFSAESHRGFLKLGISNTANQPQKGRDGSLQSSKASKSEHGFGLKNVEKAVENYDGMLQTDFSEGIFTLNILLCNIQND